MTVKFLKLKDPYGCFSNFWKCDITYEGQTWPTSEHLYQGLKYKGADEIYRDLIRRSGSAWDAAALGRRGKNMRPEWDLIRVAVMSEVVLAKFTQHESLRKVLVSTGDQEIVEDFHGCAFWGIGDGTGKNIMGKVLMDVRKMVEGMPFTQLTLI